MAAITATEFTVTVNDEQIVAKKRRNRCTLTLGTGGNEYGSGLPLPTGSAFGMRRSLDYLHIYSFSHGDGYVWKYNPTGATIRGYQTASTLATQSDAAVALVELATSVTLTTRTFYCEAVGW